MKTNELYELWCLKATEDGDLISELSGIKENDDEIFDRFYKYLLSQTFNPRYCCF